MSAMYRWSVRREIYVHVNSPSASCATWQSVTFGSGKSVPYTQATRRDLQGYVNRCASELRVRRSAGGGDSQARGRFASSCEDRSMSVESVGRYGQPAHPRPAGRLALGAPRLARARQLGAETVVGGRRNAHAMERILGTGQRLRRDRTTGRWARAGLADA
jgi:hypothetical protein